MNLPEVRRKGGPSAIAAHPHGDTGSARAQPIPNPTREISAHDPTFIDDLWALVTRNDVWAGGASRGRRLSLRCLELIEYQAGTNESSLSPRPSAQGGLFTEKRKSFFREKKTQRDMQDCKGNPIKCQPAHANVDLRFHTGCHEVWGSSWSHHLRGSQV